MNAENMREFKFRVQYELKDGTRGWLYSPKDVSNLEMFGLKNAGNRNCLIEVPEIVNGERTGNYIYAAIVEESFGQWTGLKDCKGVDIWEGDRICWKNLTNNTVWNETIVFSEGCFVGDETDETITPGQTRVIGNIHDAALPQGE